MINFLPCRFVISSIVPRNSFSYLPNEVHLMIYNNCCQYHRLDIDKMFKYCCNHGLHLHTTITFHNAEYLWENVDHAQLNFRAWLIRCLRKLIFKHSTIISTHASVRSTREFSTMIHIFFIMKWIKLVFGFHICSEILFSLVYLIKIDTRHNQTTDGEENVKEFSETQCDDDDVFWSFCNIFLRKQSGWRQSC